MQFLSFEASDNADGVVTLEAMASTQAPHREAVMAEVRQVLDWARSAFPHTQGPAEDGMDWDQDLQVSEEPGGWHSVTLTLTASARFAEAFVERFGPLHHDEDA